MRYSVKVTDEPTHGSELTRNLTTTTVADVNGCGPKRLIARNLRALADELDPPRRQETPEPTPEPTTGQDKPVAVTGTHHSVSWTPTGIGFSTPATDPWKRGDR